MKKISALLVLLLITSSLATTAVFADTPAIKSTFIPSENPTLPYDLIYYQVANKAYQNYLKGQDTTVIGLKGVKFENIRSDAVDQVASIMNLIGGLTADVTQEQFGDITKVTVIVQTMEDYKNSAALDKAIDSLMAEASNYSSVKDKLGYINDKIVSLSEYDHGTYEGVDSTAEGALVNKTAICAGFQDAVYEICKKLGVKETTFIAPGKAGHTANFVMIDGTWYLWDLTWNVSSKPSSREYFMVPLSSMQFTEYLRDTGVTSSFWGDMELCKTIKFSDMSSVDLSLGILEVDASKLGNTNTELDPIDVTPPTGGNTSTPSKPSGNDSNNGGVISIGGDGQIIDTPKTPSKPATKKATPVNSKVMVDGKKVAFEEYSIDGSSYFKLRDIAMAIKGSTKKFSVTWDSKKGAINILTSTAYKATGGELVVPKNPTSKTATLSTAKVYVNGKEVKLTVYSINGAIYFKLKDLGKSVNFNVTWDAKTSSIVIDTKSAYKE